MVLDNKLECHPHTFTCPMLIHVLTYLENKGEVELNGLVVGGLDVIHSVHQPTKKLVTIQQVLLNNNKKTMNDVSC
jgi:hypothetical protein